MSDPTMEIVGRRTQIMYQIALSTRGMLGARISPNNMHNRINPAIHFLSFGEIRNAPMTRAAFSAAPTPSLKSVG
jgi:hypothetical protein